MRGAVRGNVVVSLLEVFFACLALGGCAGGAAAGGGPPPPPPPTLTIKSVGAYYAGNSPLNLPYAIAGQGSFMLLVDGTGFTSSSVVEWNGSPLPTQFGDITDLADTASSALIATPGAAAITVVDSGNRSGAVAFAIASPAAATAGAVALITAAPDGSPADGDSYVSPSISATGRYVAFQDDATNLVPGVSSNQYAQIYERDTCIGAPPGCAPAITRITVTYDGSPVNANSRDSAISADGRYVAFDSSATNILPNSGICGQQAGYACVFLRDTCVAAPSGCTPSTIPVSVNTQGTIALGAVPEMTPEGRFVSFVSDALSLGIGSTGDDDVFLRDTCNGAASGCAPSTTLMSPTSSGSPGNSPSEFPAISTTGRFVAFLSWATNMVPNETVTPGWFWRDTCLGAPSGCSPSTIRADVTTSGGQPNRSAFFGSFPAITADGRFVAFGSTASNLVPAQTLGGVFLRDTCTGAPAGCTPTTSLVSLTNTGAPENNGGGGSPGNQTNVSISTDGRFVSFGSIATNLTPDDTFPEGGWEDIFVRDTCFGVASGCTSSTVRVSVPTLSNAVTLGSANAISNSNAMSSDGHYVVFISAATNMLPGVTGNGHAMVFLAKTGF